VPLREGGSASFVGVSHGSNANTRITGGKVGIQLPAVAGAYDYEGDLAGHVGPLWVELFAKVGVGRSSFTADADGFELGHRRENDHGIAFG
jgi:hypothetical protein